MSHLEIGRPRHFDVERFLDAVEDMINADEVERALLMLDNMPAYYRDHVPERAAEIRQSLHRQLWTPVQYAGIYEGVIPDCWPGRAQVLEGLVRQLNSEGKAPHVMELAPGSGFIEAGLRERGLTCSYESLGLDKRKEPGDVSGPAIFVAFEIIEHLSNEWEIYQNYLKFNREAEHILLSTPLYTCAGGMSGWRERPLGHLRTYTPLEFQQKAQAMFKGYQWKAFVDETIILLGSKA
jgi:hypothetical protein